MPRNAIRGSRPDSLYGGTGLPFASIFDEGSRPSSPAPSATSTQAAEINTGDDGRPEPPLETYDADPEEFA